MDDVTVYRTWDESMAEMAIGLLRAEGINAWKVADVPRSVYPVSVDGLGEIEIVVPEDEAQEALDILAVRFSEGELGFIGDGKTAPEIPDAEENDIEQFEEEELFEGSEDEEEEEEK
ncbi:MAG: putative signal transducing protein [Candidatus Latescibacterota bacterium]